MIMTRRKHLYALTATLGLAMVPPALAAEPPIYGTWTGVFDPGTVQQTFRIVVDAKGVILSLSSSNQGAASFDGSEIVVDGGKLKASFQRINATFEGALSDDLHMEGVLTQGAAIKIRFTRGEVADAVSEWSSPPLTAELLRAKLSASEAPALGAAWSRGTRSAVLVSGLRSSQATVAVKATDQWHWGSIGKSMTATLCGRLVDAGVARWDMTVGEVLDQAGAPVPSAYRDVNFLHLFSHRAGLPRDVDNTGFSLALADARVERLKYANLALAMKPVGPPGAQFAYSNMGPVIAGAMLEKLVGAPWEVLIQKHVFAPLGIKHAGQGAPGTPGRLDQPLGHLVTKGKREPHPPGGPDDDNVVAHGPAGRVNMPLADLLIYLRAHRDRPTKFLKAATWERLHTPPFGSDYALGWFTRKDGRLWHDGSNTLWYAQVVVDRKSGCVYAACANDAAPKTKIAVEEAVLSARAAALA